MKIAFEICRALSMVTFLWYGFACVLAGSMVAEFERFGLAHLRLLIGSLELLGALGLLVGYFVPAIAAVASAGLGLLMVLGVATRFWVGDPVVEALPAAVLGLINWFVFAYSVGWVGPR